MVGSGKCAHALRFTVLAFVGSLLHLAPVVNLASADCTLTFTGNIPMNDLGSGMYMGYQGGLYPNGANTQPASLASAALDRAVNQIQPLSNTGKPASNGSVVLVSIGMSNTHLEFSDGATSFISQANADLGKNPKLVVVNGAQGGADAATWADPNNAVWSNLATYLAKAGTKAVQVQVAWLKEAVKDPGTIGPFPTHAVTLQNNLEAIARN